MTQRLTKMEIDRVDLVDAGANGRRFALFKRADAPPADPPMQLDEGWLAKITKAIAGGIATTFGIPEPVEKAMTFAQIIAGREISAALEENWWVLQDALWSAIYATDDDGSDLSLDAKKALVAQNLDEFKAFLLDRMDAGVEKSARPPQARFIEAFVAKVGRKVSAARLTRLKEAADALGAVLAEVEADDESAETQKRATPQEEDMTPEELKAAVSEVLKAELAPIRADVEALKKSAGGESEGEEQPATLDTVVEAIGKLAERVEGIEKSRGTRTSTTDDPTPVKKSKWAGVLS